MSIPRRVAYMLATPHYAAALLESTAMPEYDNTNRFVLFVNNKKEDERDPDRTGTINVNGVEYYMDGWLKHGKSGPFLSGRIKPKGEAKPAPRRAAGQDDDEIAF